MPDLMVLVPTRSRPHNVRPIIDAWWGTGAFEVAQLRFILDKDDAEFHRYKEVLAHHPEAAFSEIDEWQPMVPKLNEVALNLAAQNRADFFAFMGDDHMPRSSRWAHLLVERHLLVMQGKRNLFQYGRDGYQDDKLPTWWSVGRDWIMALGKMVPAPVEHLYCDNAMLALAKAVNTCHWNSDVYIEHMHPVAGKGVSDAQYQRVNRGEQYSRDGLAFETWMKDGLPQAVTLLQDVVGG